MGRAMVRRPLFCSDTESFHFRIRVWGPLPYPVRALLVILSPAEVFGITPSSSFILPPIKLKLATVMGMSKNYSHTNIYSATFKNEVIITSFLIFSNFFVSRPILLKFGTEMLFSITNKNAKFC